MNLKPCVFVEPVHIRAGWLQVSLDQGLAASIFDSNPGWWQEDGEDDSCKPASFSPGFEIRIVRIEDRWTNQARGGLSDVVVHVNLLGVCVSALNLHH